MKERIIVYNNITDLKSDEIQKQDILRLCTTKKKELVRLAVRNNKYYYCV